MATFSTFNFGPEIGPIIFNKAMEIPPPPRPPIHQLGLEGFEDWFDGDTFGDKHGDWFDEGRGRSGGGGTGGVKVGSGGGGTGGVKGGGGSTINARGRGLDNPLNPTPHPKPDPFKDDIGKYDARGNLDIEKMVID